MQGDQRVQAEGCSSSKGLWLNPEGFGHSGFVCFVAQAVLSLPSVRLAHNTTPNEDPVLSKASKGSAGGCGQSSVYWEGVCYLWRITPYGPNHSSSVCQRMSVWPGEGSTTSVFRASPDSTCFWV